MCVLSPEKKTEVLKAILEGCSIRSVERLTGVHRDTVMRLCVKTGMNCNDLHDRFIQNVSVSSIEFDELWSYVGLKQKNMPVIYPACLRETTGDQYLFVALESHTKLVLAYHVGKRSRDDALIFLSDLKGRITGKFQLNSDKFNPYEGIIGMVFGAGVSYGQIVKNYDKRGRIKSVSSRNVSGSPTDISTTYVERNNLTLRMGIRRLARKTNAFSKKMPNHCSAIAMFITWYNFCRVHQTLKTTPAMAAGITDKIWGIEDLMYS